MLTDTRATRATCLRIVITSMYYLITLLFSLFLYRIMISRVYVFVSNVYNVYNQFSVSCTSFTYILIDHL